MKKFCIFIIFVMFCIFQDNVASQIFQEDLARMLIMDTVYDGGSTRMAVDEEEDIEEYHFSLSIEGSQKKNMKVNMI